MKKSGVPGLGAVTVRQGFGYPILLIALLVIGTVFTIVAWKAKTSPPPQTTDTGITGLTDYGNGVYGFPRWTTIEEYRRSLSVFLGAHPDLKCSADDSRTLICYDTATPAQDDTQP